MVELPRGMDEEARSYVAALVAAAQAQNAFAVVLTGSMARDVPPTSWSDVDLYALDVVASEPPAAVHLFEVKVTQFEHQVLAGDDVAQWAARYGRPLFGQANWTSLVRRLLPEAPWPDHRVKLAQAKRRLETSRLLLDAGDAASAQKELVYAASHLARALLLERDVFPLSRPELPDQLRGLNEQDVARSVETVASARTAPLEDLLAIWTAVDRRRLEADQQGIATRA